MTVSYQSDVASSTSGGLIRLLWRWRGSVWKLVYRELFMFLATYITLAFSYDFLLPDPYKRVYEKVVIVCSAFVDMIPLSFILGFYVSFTASRWWQQYIAIPWPDKIMNNLAMYVPGSDETSRILRRTLMRYLNLSLVMVLRSISIAVKRRFPTKEHLIEAGFMTKPELEMFSAVPATEFNTFWIPCTWFVNLLREARQECRITDSSGLKLIMEEFNEYRNKLGLLWSYDWVSIPLVYTQVVTISTYAFFVASIFGRQHVNPPKYPDMFLTEIEHRGEYYIPVFTILQFLLYMGLLKLGEQLINPFGDDDEDFELNWIIDRHIKVSFLGVDVLNMNPPPLMKDNYFDESDIKLPYTAAAVSYKKKTYRGSMAAYHVPSEQQGLVVPDFDEDDHDQHDREPPSNILGGGSEKRSRDSVWSVLGGKLSAKYAGSASLISLDSENLDPGNQSDTWQGSSMSFLAGQEGDRPGQSSVMAVVAAAAATGTSIAGGPGGPGPSPGADEAADKASLGIRGPRPRLDSLAVYAGMQSSSNSSPHGSTTTSNMPGTPAVSGFDPTLGIFLSMHPKEGPAGRKSSSASLSKVPSSQYIPGTPYPLGARGVSPVPPGNVSRSSSSASKKASVASCKLKPAGMLKLRKADPRLTIRPFRSKVTFSDDTKEASAGSGTPLSLYHVPIAKPSRGMRQDGVDLTISSPELSEADLLTAYIEHNRGNKSPTSPGCKNAPQLPHIPSKPPFISGSIAANAAASGDCRRQSSFGQDVNQPPLFPTDLIAAIGLPSEYWLRHQSLPNIQEIGEEGSTGGSPTGNAPSRLRASIRRQNSDKISDRNKIPITRQGAEERSSPPKDAATGPPHPPPAAKTEASRQSADDRRRKYSNTGGSSGSTSLGSAAAAPPAQRRHRKRAGHPPSKPSALSSTSASSGVPGKPPKQSSTESEGHVAPASFYIQISEEELDWKKSSHSTSSSIASYASARDMFGRLSLDAAIPIPTIVVLQTTPSNSDQNLSQPPVADTGTNNNNNRDSTRTQDVPASSNNGSQAHSAKACDKNNGMNKKER